VGSRSHLLGPLQRDPFAKLPCRPSLHIEYLEYKPWRRQATWFSSAVTEALGHDVCQPRPCQQIALRILCRTPNLRAFQYRRGLLPSGLPPFRAKAHVPVPRTNRNHAHDKVAQTASMATIISRCSHGNRFFDRPGCRPGFYGGLEPSCRRLFVASFAAPHAHSDQ
jgi:hypothetical protein